MKALEEEKVKSMRDPRTDLRGDRKYFEGTEDDTLKKRGRHPNLLSAILSSSPPSTIGRESREQCHNDWKLSCDRRPWMYDQAGSCCCCWLTTDPEDCEKSIDFLSVSSSAKRTIAGSGSVDATGDKLPFRYRGQGSIPQRGRLSSCHLVICVSWKLPSHRSSHARLMSALNAFRRCIPCSDRIEPFLSLLIDSKFPSLECTLSTRRRPVVQHPLDHDTDSHFEN